MRAGAKAAVVARLDQRVRLAAESDASSRRVLAELHCRARVGLDAKTAGEDRLTQQIPPAHQSRSLCSRWTAARTCLQATTTEGRRRERPTARGAEGKRRVVRKKAGQPARTEGSRGGSARRGSPAERLGVADDAAAAGEEDMASADAQKTSARTSARTHTATALPSCTAPTTPRTSLTSALGPQAPTTIPAPRASPLRCTDSMTSSVTTPRMAAREGRPTERTDCGTGETRAPDEGLPSGARVTVAGALVSDDPFYMGRGERGRTVEQDAQVQAGLVPRDLDQAGEEALIALELRQVLDRPDERRTARRGAALRCEVDELLEDRGAERDARPAGDEDDGRRVEEVGVHEAAIRTCEREGESCQRERSGEAERERAGDAPSMAHLITRASFAPDVEMACASRLRVQVPVDLARRVRACEPLREQVQDVS